MCDSAIHAVDHLGADIHGEEFLAPLFVGGLHGVLNSEGLELLHIAVDGDPCLLEGSDDAELGGVGKRGVNEHALRGIAD